MTKKKSTKRALLMSALALLMCVSMLVGSTFAWFTDSVTSAGNIIQSGTLKVTMEWKDATAAGAQQSYKDASEGAIFNYDKWEPGYVEAKNIKIKNIGTLALRYQLNILANGEVSKLADVIDVYYADGEVALTDRDMAGLGYLGTLSKVLKEINTTASGNLLAGAGHTVTLALKMQETAGNEYQGLAIGSSFAVQLLATQLTAEEDSFDEMYDKDAAWDGTIPATKPDTLVVDTNAKLISINDPAAFAYLNTLLNDGNFTANYGHKWQYTVELNCDINLLGQEWTPIVLSNVVAFDGKGHTISNLYVVGEDSVGLFSEIRCNDIGATIVKDLTIDGAYVKGKKSVGVLAGMNPQGNIEKVTINNATVIGSKYVGGVFGHGNGYVKDSTVKNSTITIPENGEKEAGGLIGYLSNDGLSSTVDKVISGNRVENVTVTAPTIASGLVSQPNSSNEGSALIVIKDNTMKKVTITTTKDATADYYVSNNVGGKSKVENNSAEDCVLSVAVSTADELIAALANGGNVVLTDDIEMESATTAPYGNKYAVKFDGGVLDGNGNELYMECYGDDYGIMTSGGTIKNVTIKEGCRAVMIMYPQSDVILDNVNIGGDGVLYPINTGEGGAVGVDLIVTNSTLAGWTSYGLIESASFTNVKFEQGTYYNNIYGRVLKPYVNTTLTDCSFVKAMNLDLSSLKEGHKITIENCTVDGQKVAAETFTIPTTDAQYDTELFTVDLPSWASSINDCIIFAD